MHDPSLQSYWGFLDLDLSPTFAMPNSMMLDHQYYSFVSLCWSCPNKLPQV